MAHKILFSVVLCFVSHLEIKDDVLWQEGWDSHASPPQRYQNTDVPFQQTAFKYLMRCFWESC